MADVDGKALEVRVLGPLEVLVADERVELGSAKQRLLVGVLVLHAPHPVPVARIVDAIWPDDPPRDPLRSIQVYVSNLRQALGDAGAALATQGRAYRLDVIPDQTDAGRFEHLAQTCRTRLEDGDPSGAVAAANEALAMWRGEAWQDLRQVPGAEPAAARLAEMRVDVLTARLEALLAQGHHRELVPELEALAVQHPLREDVLGLLMLALHRCGRQADALQVYAEARGHKVAETGLDPGAALQQLQSRILTDDASLRVEDAELRRRRHLPAPATRLVGRRDEVDEVCSLLRGEARLVTLTGPGGVGKTRAALQVAHELAGEFPDGVWFVGLAHVTDHRLVPQTVAEALGVDDPTGDFPGALRTQLASRRMLVLLDNLEQVVDAATLISDLLAASAELRFLVTSRLRLRIYGEWVRPLDPLPVDDAMPLFVERAHSVDRRFAAADDDVRRVVDALDRLPLAIELVAARVPDLGVPEVLAGLASRLDLAAEGPRDRDARQRTLRGALAWSVDLLSPGERSVFERLAVFAGGAAPEAVAAVVGDGDDVDGLVLASLVSREPGGRVTMLEVIREYAAEMLAAGASEAAAREDHAAYFLELSEEAMEAMRGHTLTTWLARLLADRANLRVAFTYLIEHAAGDSPAGTRALRLAAALNMFLYRTSPAGEDTEWLVRALAAAPDADRVLRGRALHGLAICRGEAGRIDEALAASRKSVDLLRTTGEEVWLARTLNTLGGLTRDTGDAASALPILTESVDLRRRLADPAAPVAITLENLAMTALDAGDLPLARASMLECRALAEDEEDEALAMLVLADIALAEGELGEAAALLAESMPVLRGAAHLRYRLLECLETAAALAAVSGQPALAAALVAAIDTALAEDGASLVPADLRNRERRLGPALASLDRAELATVRDEGAGWSLDEAAEQALRLASGLTRVE